MFTWICRYGAGEGVVHSYCSPYHWTRLGLDTTPTPDQLLLGPWYTDPTSHGRRDLDCYRDENAKSSLRGKSKRGVGGELLLEVPHLSYPDSTGLLLQ